MDEKTCNFYKRCTNVNKLSPNDSWASNEKRFIRNANTTKTISFSQCWLEKCKNCSFFSWDSESKICTFSNDNSEICLHSDLNSQTSSDTLIFKVAVFRKGIYITGCLKLWMPKATFHIKLNFANILIHSLKKFINFLLAQE